VRVRINTRLHVVQQGREKNSTRECTHHVPRCSSSHDTVFVPDPAKKTLSTRVRVHIVTPSEHALSPLPTQRRSAGQVLDAMLTMALAACAQQNDKSCRKASVRATKRTCHASHTKSVACAAWQKTKRPNDRRERHRRVECMSGSLGHPAARKDWCPCTGLGQLWPS
jgi:hypothetical protein